jgi:hypothetical protein
MTHAKATVLHTGKESYTLLLEVPGRSREWKFLDAETERAAFQEARAFAAAYVAAGLADTVTLSEDVRQDFVTNARGGLR